MNFFKSYNGPRQKAFVGSNLVIVAKGSSTHSVSLVSPGEGLASMATQGLEPSALTTVSGGKVARDELGLGRGGVSQNLSQMQTQIAGNR